MEMHIPEILQPVSLLNPQTTDGEPNSEELNLSNAHMAYIVVHLTQASAEATVLTVEESEDGAGHATIDNDVRIWADHDVDDNDEELERRDDATAYTVPSETDNMMVVFQIDPRVLSGDNNEVRINITDPTDATNYASIVAYVVPRYQG